MPIFHGPVISLFLFFALKNILILLAKPDSGDLPCPATALIFICFIMPHCQNVLSWYKKQMSQLMRLWYLSHRWPTKAQVSPGIRAVSPEPSLFAHMKYGSRRRGWPKIRHLTQLDGCACTFEEWVYGGGLRLWHFSSPLNSFFKCACAAIWWG